MDIYIYAGRFKLDPYFNMVLCCLSVSDKVLQSYTVSFVGLNSDIRGKGVGNPV